MSYVLMTDSSADLPWDYYRTHAIEYLPMTVTLDGKTFLDNGSVPAANYFNALRGGSSATTSQIGIADFTSAFERIFQSGRDVMYVGLSGTLSGSNQSAFIARDELREKYPERRAYVGHSTIVSLGLGLMVHELRVRRDAGATMDELIEYYEANQPKLQHLFTVSDLMHLLRGGRVGRTSAVVGSVLGIKPMLHVSHEGRLLSHGKARGRRQSLEKLVEEMSELVTGEDLGSIALSHGDCEDEARSVIDMISRRFRFSEAIVHTLGPTIGAHAGPGTIALFFFGAPRTQ